MKNIIKNFIVDINKDIDEWLEDLAYNTEHQDKPKLKKFKKDKIAIIDIKDDRVNDIPEGTFISKETTKGEK